MIGPGWRAKLIHFLMHFCRPKYTLSPFCISREVHGVHASGRIFTPGESPDHYESVKTRHREVLFHMTMLEHSSISAVVSGF